MRRSSLVSSRPPPPPPLLFPLISSLLPLSGPFLTLSLRGSLSLLCNFFSQLLCFNDTPFSIIKQSSLYNCGISDAGGAEKKLISYGFGPEEDRIVVAFKEVCFLEIGF